MAPAHQVHSGVHDNVSLLNLILSFDSPTGRSRRDLIRAGWLSRLQIKGYNALFVIGGSSSPGYIQQDELWLPTDDMYKGGPSKVIDALQYVIEHEAEVGTHTYYLKSDDDTLVCTEHLMHWLRRGSLPSARVYAGQQQPTLYELRILPPEHKFQDYNFITVFNQTRYFPYMLGGGYLMSKDIVRHAVTRAGALNLLAGGKWRLAKQMPCMEDAFIGALVANSTELYDLPVTASSFTNHFKLDVQYPDKFCQFIGNPKILCNAARGKEWCQTHRLSIVHPVELVLNKSIPVRRSPAWRMSHHAKVVVNESAGMRGMLKLLKRERVFGEGVRIR